MRNNGGLIVSTFAGLGLGIWVSVKYLEPKHKVLMMPEQKL